MGRVGSLGTASTPSDLISHLKASLNLPYLRVATANDGKPEQTVIRRVAVSGRRCLRGFRCQNHDCIVTGEMRHHDVLAAQREGISHPDRTY